MILLGECANDILGKVGDGLRIFNGVNKGKSIWQGLSNYQKDQRINEFLWRTDIISNSGLFHEAIEINNKNGWDYGAGAED